MSTLQLRAWSLSLSLSLILSLSLYPLFPSMSSPLISSPLLALSLHSLSLLATPSLSLFLQRMGIPFRRFLVSSNTNNILTDFLTSGTYDLRHRTLRTTISPAIDILVSSNLERLLHHLASETLNSDLQQETRQHFKQLASEKFFTISPEMQECLAREFDAEWCSEDESRSTISSVYQRTGYILDPHTAVAKACVNKHWSEGRTTDVPVLIASTAHWMKFADAVLPCIGFDSSSAKAHFRPAEHELLKSIFVDSGNIDEKLCCSDIDTMKEIVMSNRNGSVCH